MITRTATDRSAAARKAAATRKARKEAAVSATTESVSAMGQTHAGIDIAGLRLIEDGAGYWIALKGVDRRMGTVAQISAGRYIATGRGMASCAVDSAQEGGEFIARSWTGQQSDRVRTPQMQVRADLKDSARARNLLRTFKSRTHKTAHVTLVARIERLTEMAGKATDRYSDRDNRASLAGSEIAARRLADAQAQRTRATETVEWVENLLTLEADNLRALRDKALGLGIAQAEIEKIVSSVRKVKADDMARELADLAALFAD